MLGRGWAWAAIIGKLEKTEPPPRLWTALSSLGLAPGFCPVVGIRIVSG